MAELRSLVRRLTPQWLASTWVFIRSQAAHSILFLVVNAIIGSLGVWMPILASVSRTDVYAKAELIKVLAACGPYTFAVAYLAASTAYVATEYMDKQDTGHRKLKTTLGLFSFVVIILCTLLSALQTSPNVQGTTAGIAVTSESKDVGQSTKTAQLGASEQFQLAMTGLATLIGLALFVVSRVETEDYKQQLVKWEKRNQRDSHSLAAAADNATSPDVKL